MIVGLFFLVGGLIFLIFNKFVTEFYIDQQELFGSHFSERTRKITRISFIIAGILLTALGVFSLLVD